MSEASSNEQVREDIARALRGLDRDRLLELVSELVKIYVIEGSAPWAVAEPGADPFDGGRPPSFARLMTDLKARLALPELECFRVEGDRVSVTVGDQTLILGRTAPPRPPTGPLPRQPSPRPPDERRPAPPGERSRLLEVD